MAKNDIYVCHHAAPPGEYECHEAICSQGRACMKCPIDCYRQGWSKDSVDADNKKFVERKHQSSLCDDCGEMVAENQFYIAGVQCLACAKAQEEDAIRGEEGRFTIPEEAEDDK